MAGARWLGKGGSGLRAGEVPGQYDDSAAGVGLPYQLGGTFLSASPNTT